MPYTNTSDLPVTLSLKLDAVTGDDGTTLKWSPVSLKTSSVTVPAGGTVTIPLAVDPAVKLTAAQYGDITGRILATGGATVSTPFALHIAPETVDLTIRMTDRNGAPADWSVNVTDWPAAGEEGENVKAAATCGVPGLEFATTMLREAELEDDPFETLSVTV